MRLSNLIMRRLFLPPIMALLFGVMDRGQEQTAWASDLFDRLVAQSKAEMAKKEGKLTIGLEWSTRQSKPVLKEFQKDFPFIKEIDASRERGVERYQSMLIQVQQGTIPKYDIIKISSDVWSDFEKAGLFVKPPFDYFDLIKALPSGWGEVDPRVIDPKGYFVATANYSHGIAYNRELVEAERAPKSWDDCLSPHWKGKLLYDPRPKLNALYHDPKTREGHIKWLKGIVKNEAVLNRGQTENLMKLAAGEYPIACGIQYSSAAGLIDKGAPLTFVLPDPISVKLSTEFHVVKWSRTPATTQLVALWMVSKGQKALDQHAYRGFPWNPGTKLHPQTKGKYFAVCDAECVTETGEEYNKLHAEILNLPGVR